MVAGQDPGTESLRIDIGQHETHRRNVNSFREMTQKQIIGNYSIQSVLGHGGMGIVYKAVSMKRGPLLPAGHTVALKLLAPRLSGDPTFVRRFQREYEIWRSFYHRNIVRVYDFGEDRGRYFVALEYIAGTSVERLLMSRHHLSPQQTASIVQQVAAALDAVHPRGVVHRDLKPGNVLIEHGGRVALTDFGVAISTMAHNHQTQANGWWGTPEFMAPEQARNDPNITYKADIYALGMMAYKMLCGHLPFERSDPLAILYAHVHEPPPSMRSFPSSAHVPASVEHVVIQTLSKNPAQRPATAGDFADELSRAAGVQRPPPSPPRQHTPHPTTNSGALTTPKHQRTPVRLSAATPPIAIIVGITLFAALAMALATPGVPEQKTITLPPTEPAVWSGPGTLAYVCQAGNETHICLGDSTGQQEIHSVGTRDWTPAWSPNGRCIAFASNNRGNSDIWVWNLDTGSTDALTADSQSDESSPAWSPNGEIIAYDKQIDGNYDIYAQRIDTPGISILTASPALDTDPTWSPDGRSIAFASDRENDDLELYVKQLDSRIVTRLTNHTGRDFAPVWSPDGNWIAYECEDNADGDIEICKINVNSHDVQILTHNAVDDRQPAWSPDGQSIAFCRKRDGGSLWDIWAMSASGNDQQVWIRDNYSNTHPTWKPLGV